MKTFCAELFYEKRQQISQKLRAEVSSLRLGKRQKGKMKSKMVSECSFITHSVLCRPIKINRFFVLFCFLFQNSISFQIIIIFAALNEYLVCGKNKYGTSSIKTYLKEREREKSHCIMV